MASATSLINTPTGPKSQISDHLANASVESLQIEHGDGDHIPAVPSSPLDVRPTSSSISEDSIALSLATETSQNESFAFAMEKGFWRVQQGAQELLRFADLYRTRRDGTTADPDFLATGSLPKEIDLVSMTQLSWGVVHAVGDINNHNRKQAESYKWMRDDDKSSHRKHKRSKKKASSDLEAFNACKKCGVMDTPRWRDGPAGPLTLCNVCGLLYAKRSQRHGSGSESYWRRESLGGRD